MKLRAAQYCLFAIIAVVTGCDPDQTPNRRDLKILSIVASHFASQGDPHYEKEGMVLVSRMTQAARQDGDPKSYYRDDAFMEKYVDIEMLNDFVQRNAQPHPLDGLNESSSYRLSNDEDLKWAEAGKWPPSIRMSVALHLPGISRDGHHAFVRISIPWFHGAWATYILVKEHGEWKIQDSDVRYYEI
jgi:hypothetical protein